MQASNARRVVLSIIIPSTRSLNLALALQARAEALDGFLDGDVQIVAVAPSALRYELTGSHLPFKMSSRVTMVWLDHTTSPGDARNMGLAQARGDFVLFADDDDLVNLDGVLEELPSSVDTAPDVIGGSFIRVDERGCETSWIPQTESLIDALRPLAGVWRFVIRRDFLVHNSVVFPDTHYAEDITFLLRLASHDPAFLPSYSPNYTYVDSGMNRLTNECPRVGEVIWTLRELYLLRQGGPRCKAFRQCAAAWTRRIRFRNAALYLRNLRIADSWHVLVARSTSPFPWPGVR